VLKVEILSAFDVTFFVNSQSEERVDIEKDFRKPLKMIFRVDVL